jgi:RNA polymerase sigma factor (sigma-70 family)
MTRQPFHDLLRDLPPELQRAVHHCVAQCRPHIAPRPYTNDWREELYHEAAFAACLAHTTYDPDCGGSLYQWGVRVIGQHLKRFCDRIWASAKRECDPPCDEETGEEIECEDPAAQEPFVACILTCALRQALQSLSPPDRQVAAWHLLEGLTERAIAQRLGISQRAVHNDWSASERTCASNWRNRGEIPSQSPLGGYSSLAVATTIIGRRRRWQR